MGACMPQHDVTSRIQPAQLSMVLNEIKTCLGHESRNPDLCIIAMDTLIAVSVLQTNAGIQSIFDPNGPLGAVGVTNLKQSTIANPNTAHASGKLNAGEIAGIAIGSMAGLVLAVLLIALITMLVHQTDQKGECDRRRCRCLISRAGTAEPWGFRPLQGFPQEAAFPASPTGQYCKSSMNILRCLGSQPKDI